MVQNLHKKKILCIIGIACFLPAMLFVVPTVRAKAQEKVTLSSAQDLIAFSRAVNEGNSYADTLVVLTQDIDLAAEEFTPVGLYGTNRYFEGVLDGCGYSVSGLYVTRTENEANNGLFGVLAGDVKNLAVGGYVSGNCCGGIASHGTGNATILNCYSSVLLDANRGGGIADNLSSGEIINCYSVAETPDGNALPLVSYTAGRIAYSVSKGNLTGTEQPQNIEFCLERQSEPCFDHLNQTIYELFLAGEDVSTLCVWENGLTNNRYQLNHSLSGTGTKGDPYLISSVADFAFFRLQVAQGNEYRNRFLRQTQDLDFSSRNGKPVGVYASEHYFFGTYDGYGHTIENLLIDRSDGKGNNALFGVLGGVVKNLGLESGRIVGNCCASFAITAASGRATIVNCYSRLTFSSRTRSGGIVDNFEGYVVGCWYDGTLPLVSYNALLLSRSFTGGREVTDMTHFLFSERDNRTEYTDFDTKSFSEVLNQVLPFSAADSGQKIETLFTFALQDGKTVFAAQAKASDYSFLDLVRAYPYTLFAVAAGTLAVCILFFARGREE